MAPRATLKQETLVKLGAERLARLILEEALRNAPFKRIATAALAAAEGPDAVAAIVDKRLAALERARGVVDYDRRKAFLADLESLVAVITGELGRGGIPALRATGCCASSAAPARSLRGSMIPPARCSRFTRRPR